MMAQQMLSLLVLSSFFHTRCHGILMHFYFFVCVVRETANTHVQRKTNANLATGHDSHNQCNVFILCVYIMIWYKPLLMNHGIPEFVP